MAPKRKR
jgi:hypothetical protein